MKTQIYRHSYFRFLLQLFSIRNMPVWIGLNDKAIEGRWVWINGERAVVPAAVMWQTGQPDNAQEDCAEIIADNRFSYGTNDATCSLNRVGLCEKEYTL